ncbi:AMP-dependent synthetase/ligase [Gordonia hydrophobica]|uniref:AMP-dependent synthetase/ligase n=1 Tax=Gordonia hydrophobica TaxID=40516 RepID=A0ABZ2U4Y6_9ACTN|nr:AMP-dependent synthetase/ligase [Gordonia hydrophobica]MBM7368245.1 long-chain acyl-CoA synthetase [Gordonia hydrophobica]
MTVAAPSVTMRTIPELLTHNAITLTGQPAVSWRAESVTTTFSWSVYRERVMNVARGLLGLGVGPDHNVAILLGNTVEHLLTDLATVHCGAASISVYQTFSDVQIMQVLSDARPAVLIVDDDAAVERIDGLAWSGQENCLIVTVAPSQRTTDWGALCLAGEEAEDEIRRTLESRIADIDADRPVTYIYTSGTTGPPKAVTLSGANIASAVDSLISSGTVDFDYRSVSYLPLAHIVERLWSLYVPLRLGGHVVCCPDPNELPALLAAFHPTYFFGVPRIFAKLRSGVEQMLTSPAMADAADEIAHSRELLAERSRLLRSGRPVPESLTVAAARARGGALRGIRMRLGLDRVGAVGCGAAAMPEELHEFWASLGIDVSLGYGMTENSGVVTGDRPGTGSAGSVGFPLPGWQVRIDDDGEILVKGPGNTPGYRNRPEATAALYTADGWLRTGDIGRLDDTGRLYITDRKKDLLINAAGKNISPTSIEGALTGRSIIDQVVVFGEGQRYIVALITLEPNALREFAARSGLVDAEPSALCTAPAITGEVDRLVDIANSRLSRPEQIKRYTILPDVWTTQSGEMTPTMKLRRDAIKARYNDVVESLYNTEPTS